MPVSGVFRPVNNVALHWFCRESLIFPVTTTSLCPIFIWKSPFSLESERKRHKPHRKGVPVLKYGKMTPVPDTVAPSGEDRNKDRDAWLGRRVDRSPESTAVREEPRAGVWNKRNCVFRMQKNRKDKTGFKWQRKQDRSRARSSERLCVPSLNWTVSVLA